MEKLKQKTLGRINKAYSKVETVKLVGEDHSDFCKKKQQEMQLE